MPGGKGSPLSVPQCLVLPAYASRRSSRKPHAASQTPAGAVLPYLSLHGQVVAYSVGEACSHWTYKKTGLTGRTTPLWHAPLEYCSAPAISCMPLLKWPLAMDPSELNSPLRISLPVIGTPTGLSLARKLSIISFLFRAFLPKPRNGYLVLMLSQRAAP